MNGFYNWSDTRYALLRGTHASVLYGCSRRIGDLSPSSHSSALFMRIHWHSPWCPLMAEYLSGASVSPAVQDEGRAMIPAAQLHRPGWQTGIQRLAFMYPGMCSSVRAFISFNSTFSSTWQMTPEKSMGAGTPARAATPQDAWWATCSASAAPRNHCGDGHDPYGSGHCFCDRMLSRNIAVIGIIGHSD